MTDHFYGRDAHEKPTYYVFRKNKVLAIIVKYLLRNGKFVLHVSVLNLTIYW